MTGRPHTEETEPKRAPDSPAFPSDAVRRETMRVIHKFTLNVEDVQNARYAEGREDPRRSREFMTPPRLPETGTEHDAACELPSCKSTGDAKRSVGRFQVYDPDLNMATMNRPAYLCQACVDFAKSCGMDPRPEPEAESR